MTNRRADWIKAIEAEIGDARGGLPEDVFLFVSRLTPLVNVDLLIKDPALGTLLTWRDDEFFGPGWHVPGGIIRYKESAADRLRACAHDELGAGIVPGAAPLLILEDVGSQESRGHHISLLYRCQLVTPPDASRQAVDPPTPGHWRWHSVAPANLLDEQREYARFF